MVACIAKYLQESGAAMFVKPVKMQPKAPNRGPEQDVQVAFHPSQAPGNRKV
jgi:hypothetical protein